LPLELKLEKLWTKVLSVIPYYDGASNLVGAILQGKKRPFILRRKEKKDGRKENGCLGRYTVA
jgi:hypothetical protein